MWPKALAQLIELAPHIGRLLPLADRFFQSRTGGEEAMQQIADGLRSDLGHVTASHAGLYRQLNEQSEKLSELNTDLRATKVAIESSEARMVTLEQQIKVLRTLLIVVLLFAVLILTLLIVRK